MPAHSGELQVLLGSGGYTPQVALLESVQSQPRSLVELPRDDSVYAIALAMESSAAAVAATKSGRLLALDWTREGESDASAVRAEHFQGAPVLSVCFIGSSNFAASDAAGRCLVWDRHIGNEPAIWETESRVICSLVLADEQTLVGLSSDGRLLFWQLPEGRLRRTLPGPPPTRPLALCRLLFWQAARALAYPAAGGLLATYRCGASNVRTASAHRGGFSGLTVLEDDLVTIGWCDGRAKRWRHAGGSPVFEAPAPEGILSCIASCAEEPQLLLVQARGTASFFCCDGQQLQLVRTIPGDNYRTAVGPSWSVIKSRLDTHRAEEVRSLAIDIHERSDESSAEEVETCHARLTELGYEHVSLGLRAEQARRRGDLIAELQAYRRLGRIVSADQASAVPALCRYAAVLERTWQLREACKVLDQIARLDVGAATARDRLVPFLKALNAGDVVIAPDEPLSVILHAAATVGVPVPGRLVVDVLRPVACQGMTLSAHEIAGKYNEVCQAGGKRPPVQALVETVCWMTQASLEQVDLIAFKGQRPLVGERVQVGLKVVNAVLQTVVAPVILFDPAGAEHSNGNGIPRPPTLQEISDQAASNGCLAELARIVGEALQRLVTKAHSLHVHSAGARHDR